MPSNVPSGDTSDAAKNSPSNATILPYMNFEVSSAFAYIPAYSPDSYMRFMISFSMAVPLRFHVWFLL